MLDATGVTFTYSVDSECDIKSFAAVDNVSFKIKKGDFVTILGRNGSGKSTLAKLMNALFLPAKGTIFVNGVDTKNEEMLWDIRKNVGMVFQNPDNQIVATIVEEDVAFGLENLGVPQAEIRQSVDRALETVDMTEYAQRSPYMLSGGQKQRVAIAGIIAMRPSCIVLDEPTAMLDPKGRREVMETIKMLNEKEGITIVLITHFVDEAVSSDAVFIMDNGQIVRHGEPADIISDYKFMTACGLEVPVVSEISAILRENGISLDDKIIDTNELVEQLCQLKPKI